VAEDDPDKVLYRPKTQYEKSVRPWIWWVVLAAVVIVWLFLHPSSLFYVFAVIVGLPLAWIILKAYIANNGRG
jgi:uncharacterized membrane protein